MTILMSNICVITILLIALYISILSVMGLAFGLTIKGLRRVISWVFFVSVPILVILVSLI